MHHPAAALSTTCGADGGPLTLSVSSDPFPSHPPYSLRSSRAPTRGTSANQSAFPHRGPSFRFPVRRPARVGLWMVPAIESDSEHDRGASRTPTTARTVARLHRSTTRRPVLYRGRARLSWVARYLAERASRTGMGQGPASTPPTDTPAIARKCAFTPTHGVRTPPVATSWCLGCLPEGDRRPRLGFRRCRLPPEDRFVCLPAKENRLRLPEVPSVQGYSVKSRETWCHPRTSAHLLPRRATAFDDTCSHGPEEPSA